ncbi:hypothetical protein SSAG_00249 [Streptomyces sp. Mg1]|nr:hypothetical protein SSAG_00249 [Streptomyces sp. Mg1]
MTEVRRRLGACRSGARVGRGDERRLASLEVRDAELDADTA